MTDGDKADLTAVCEFDKSALKKVSPNFKFHPKHFSPQDQASFNSDALKSWLWLVALSFALYSWSLFHQVETVEKTALPTKEDIEAEKAEASS